jgi:hypothetical protein
MVATAGRLCAAQYSGYKNQQPHILFLCLFLLSLGSVTDSSLCVGVTQDALLRRMRHFTMCTLGEESLELSYSTVQQRLAVRR